MPKTTTRHSSLPRQHTRQGITPKRDVDSIMRVLSNIVGVEGVRVDLNQREIRIIGWEYECQSDSFRIRDEANDDECLWTSEGFSVYTRPDAETPAANGNIYMEAYCIPDTVSLGDIFMWAQDNVHIAAGNDIEIGVGYGSHGNCDDIFIRANDDIDIYAENNLRLRVGGSNDIKIYSGGGYVDTVRTGWVDDGTNFRITFAYGFLIAIADSTAGGHS